MDTSEYCREIETYLCRKNDGHLIRVVGPSFDMVSRWAEEGVPLKIAFGGIDRCFERYYRKGPRRRPVRIDFCEADVLDMFDEWRRAVGLPAGHAATPVEAGVRRPSLPAHLERAVLRLTNARATGLLGPEADHVIDRVSGELDGVREAGRSFRGPARLALMGRMAELDIELLRIVRTTLSDDERQSLERDAGDEMRPFRDRLSPDAYARAREAACDRLVRERFQLPTLEPSA